MMTISAITPLIRLPRQDSMPVAAPMRLVRSAGLILLAAALFTASWDRLGNVAAGPYNVKLPSVLFSVAAVAGLAMLPSIRRRWAVGRLLRVVFLVSAAIVLVLVLAVILSPHPQSGLAQIVAVLTGAVLPCFAVVALLDGRPALLWGMRWFVSGAILASVFGVYQLVAFYLDLPQLVDYSGTGVASDVGRIAGFNYEPAYFANFLLLAIGVAATAALLRGRVLGWIPVGWFTAVLVLANVRALLFVVPVALVLLALRWRQNRLLILRAVVAGVLLSVVNVGVIAGVVAIQDAQNSAGSPPAATAAPVAPSSPVSVDPAEPVDPQPNAAGPALQNPLDPTEQSSNAPRLALYKAVLGVIRTHPVLGVGPGALGWALAKDGYVAPNQGGVTVANNIWLQSMADGGVPLLLLEGALIVTMAVVLLQRRYAPAQPMISAWLAVVLVSGMLTSYFFDVKVWVVLALVVCSAIVLREEAPEAIDGARERAAR